MEGDDLGGTVVNLALRSLQRSPGRVAASVGGVALSVVLVLLLSGLYFGFLAQSSVYIESTDADVWVMQRGSKDMSHFPSLLPLAAADEARAVDGVASATPLLARAVQTPTPDGEKDVVVVGFDAATGRGGPWRLVDGVATVAPGEVVLDRSFAEPQGLRVGDSVRILERDLRIVGIARDASNFVASYAFVDAATARALLGMEGTTNYVLVVAEPGVPPETLAARLEAAIPGAEALPREEFARTNGAEIRDAFTPILLAVVGIGLVVALAVVSITVYGAVNERIGEFGVLKAIGASNGRLYATVAAQAAASAAFGYAVGVPLTFAAAWALEEALVTVYFAIRPDVVLALAAALAAMSVAAAALPVRRIARIDPADVFRGWGG